MGGNIIYGDFFGTVTHIDEHLHSKALVFPNGADPVLLSTNGSAWGTWASSIKAEVMASAAAPNTPFDIHWAIVSDISANGYYELGVFAGPSGSEVQIATAAFIRDAVFAQEGSLPLITPRQSAGTRITAAVRGSNAAVNTCKVKLGGHQY